MNKTLTTFTALALTLGLTASHASAHESPHDGAEAGVTCEHDADGRFTDDVTFPCAYDGRWHTENGGFEYACGADDSECADCATFQAEYEDDPCWLVQSDNSSIPCNSFQEEYRERCTKPIIFTG
jgi:hypothetical protein